MKCATGKISAWVAVLAVVAWGGGLVSGVRRAAESGTMVEDSRYLDLRRGPVMKLGAPLSGGPRAEWAAKAGRLTYTVYASRAPGSGSPLAVLEEPADFTTETWWLRRVLLGARSDPLATECSMLITGYVWLRQGRTVFALDCDNAVRFRLRDAQGAEASVETRSDSATLAFEFAVEAEPGIYELEVEYVNYGGPMLFSLGMREGEAALYPR